MYDNLLESAEFYHRRYHNFSSLLIVPAVLLFLFLGLFFCFAKKEITITTLATLEPSRILTNIQSTSNNTITTNNLEENKVIKTGDLLIRYQSLGERIQKDTYQNQTDLLYFQRSQLEVLKSSFETGYNQFYAPDDYGYSQRFEDYNNQVATIMATADQQQATITSQNVASQRTQEELESLMALAEQKVLDYQNLKEAVLYGYGVDVNHIGYYIYSSYLSQLEGLETEAEKNAVVNQTLAQIEGLISQHSGEVASYKIQYASSGTHQYSASVDSQILALKSQKLSEVGLELATLDQRIIDSEGGLKLQNQNLSKTEIRASQSGVLHLNSEVENSTIIPEGTVLAQLYPLIDQEKSLKIVTYIPSREISSLAIGDSIRFMTENTSNEKVTLTSTISSIATAAISTEQGNFFRVEAETELSPEDLETVKYGLEGRFIVITGVKTYLQYYIDKFFNN